jgi:2-polyprenyl-6-methoxyphenol hydroxylase-like FAD-dependent oxidoreductase
MRVGIVGGSIAGCSAAIELGRAGHAVTVSERSRGGLKGRGAGIGTPTAAFQTLVSRDLVSETTPRFVVSRHPLAGRKDADDRYGHCALTLPLSMALLNWGDLWSELRARVPDAAYVEGRAINGVRQTDGEVVISAANGWSEAYDLVLFADGYRSLGRRTLFPDTEMAYRGYVLWRGVLEERRLSDSAPLETALYRLHYKGLPGNAVFYFVPGEGGSTDVGDRLVNWACYLPLAPEELPGFLVDRYGQRQEHSLPPGSMRIAEEERLKGVMAEHLPSYFAEIIAASRDSFVQPIYSGTVPAYARGRIALLGDAGAVAPPFTGSGVFKAMMNAVELATSLAESSSVDGALEQWSVEQTKRGDRLAALGDQMEEAFVWNAPDLSAMTEPDARTWWTRSISFPDEFSYVSEDQGLEADLMQSSRR